MKAGCRLLACTCTHRNRLPHYYGLATLTTEPSHMLDVVGSTLAHNSGLAAIKLQCVLSYQYVQVSFFKVQELHVFKTLLQILLLLQGKDTK